MAEWLPVLMFIALFALVFAGIPVAFSLILVATGAGFAVFGEHIGTQLYGQILKVSSDFILAAIPLFVFMGSVLERTGIALRLFNAFQVWMGRLPGGLALASLAMCGMFAAATGVVGAVEVVVGLMAIPAMQRARFDNRLIAGTICAGGSLGTIIPPSIVAVVYASIAQLSVGELFAASLIPGFLMLGFFLLYVVGVCILRPRSGPRVPMTDVPPLRTRLWITLTGLVPATVLIVAVLGSLLAGIASPTEAAAVGALGALVLAAGYRALNLTMLRQALTVTVRITAMIMLIVVGGTMFTGIFVASGGGRLVTDVVQTLGLEGAWLVAALLFVVFLAGFVLDWISIVLICIPIFNPLIRAAGIDPIWFAMLFMVMIQTSYLTPPMAPSIFYLRSIAPADMTYGQMYRGVMPFVLMQLAVLGAVAAFPATATWLPGLLVGF